MSLMIRVVSVASLAVSSLLSGCGGSGDADQSTRLSAAGVSAAPLPLPPAGTPVVAPPAVTPPADRPATPAPPPATPLALAVDAVLAEARTAACADVRNHVFTIDNSYVFWERAGNCPDNGYASTLRSVIPGGPLCVRADSIAGPMTNCADDAMRALLTKLVDGSGKPALGFDASHQVLQVLGAEPQALTVDTLARMPFSIIHAPRNVVIRDAQAMELLWGELSMTMKPAPAMPKVDFATHMVLGAFAGDSVGCREFGIRRVDRDASGKLTVLVEHKDINPNTICMAAISAPLHLVAVKRSEAPVEFRLVKPAALEFATLARSNISSISVNTGRIARDDVTWAALWREHSGTDDAAPRVDFSKDMVLAAFNGPDTSGCARFEIASVYLHDGSIGVDAVRTLPKPDAPVACIKMITSIAHFVTLPRVDGAVVFSTRVEYE